MKTLFKNKTKYTKQTYKKFVEFHQKQYGIYYTTYTIIFIILFIFCLIVQLQSHNYTIAILFVIAVISFILWRIFHPVHEIKNEIKSSKIQQEVEFSFKFYEPYFQVMKGREYETHHYFKIKRVIETDEFIYLYLDKNHALLLNKNGFVIGNCSDFIDFIQNKCKFKYKYISNLDNNHNTKKQK